MPYRIDYSPVAEDHLRALTARQQAIVLDRVNAQLAYEPTVPTRNRKAMRPNRLAPWELRLGDLRVYYDVEEDPEAVVQVRAVGIKRRDRIEIGGELFEL
jgi:mRNA-degrading endonuclease RelE of RelBE toxin-antitoxin system